jgi:hypothetical protein
MVSVTARKIREHGRERSSALAPGSGRVSSAYASANLGGTGGLSVSVYKGFLISYPVVGRGMVIFRDPHGHRMITTPVRRVLGEPGGETLYVETENSVYRLTFHGAPLAPMANEAAG